jgi:hypothetical protein
LQSGEKVQTPSDVFLSFDVVCTDRQPARTQHKILKQVTFDGAPRRRVPPRGAFLRHFSNGACEKKKQKTVQAESRRSKKILANVKEQHAIRREVDAAPADQSDWRTFVFNSVLLRSLMMAIR